MNCRHFPATYNSGAMDEAMTGEAAQPRAA
jgi:hypothetical protein